MGDPIAISPNLIDLLHQVGIQGFERGKDLEEASFLDLVDQVVDRLEQAGVTDGLLSLIPRSE
jgi:hypothetical protein